MFELSANTFTSRDENNKVRHIEHIREPYLSPSFAEPTPEQLADQYVSEAAHVYEMNSGLFTDLSSAAAGTLTGAESQLHREKVKDIVGSYIVDYTQSYHGFPVWRAGFSVHIAQDPMRVTSSTSTLHHSISLGNDPAQVELEYEEKLLPDSLSKLLGTGRGKKVSKINGIQLVIYQYDPAERVEFGASPEGEDAASFEQAAPTLELPPVADTIQAGTHYLAAEVLFDLSAREYSGLHWLALVEPVSGSVLYLRALISAATGKVFRMDPISLSGDPTLTPDAAESLLNAYRTTIPLTDLTSADPQPLDGTWVDLHEIENPVAAEPETTAPFSFDYNVKTTDFAAVNAYYHVNWFFSLLEGMGFNLNTYFDNTTFPVQVDPWSLGGLNVVNAHCPGNATSNGIGHFCFASAQAGQSVGIANDIRVVIHEFGHALLWDHVNSPNFGFAHSAGDGLAAILMDPRSIAPDRGLTFPWPQLATGPLDRRHDRKVADGWGWFGPRYNTGYGGEQVLSSTLFRLYQSVGGDSPYAADRAWASRYVAYLIIKAIGSLTGTTRDPEVFITALMNADLTTASFEGHPGGALHKVIRWAFEKQGMYQPNARPNLPAGTPKVTTEGNPPDVDVYIDDGRKGEYEYLYSFWESKDMWVRRSPDGGTTHQHPAVGRPNYMYVRVKNRGTMNAYKVVVKAYHCNPGTGLAWPHHWSPMDTPLAQAFAPIPPGGEAIVGPFQWRPEQFGHECLLAIASAEGDPGNDTTVFGSIPHSRFVPFDNNIGQRNVHPVLVLDWKKIFEYVKKIPFYISNPFKKPVKVELVPILPKIMKKEKLWIFFSNEGGNKFELGPYENRKAIFSVVPMPRIPSRRPWGELPIIPKPGIINPESLLPDEDLESLEENENLTKSLKFQIVTLIDGQHMGGMTYLLEPTRKKAGQPLGPVIRTALEGNDEAGDFFEVIKEQPGVKEIRVRRVNLDIEFET